VKFVKNAGRKSNLTYSEPHLAGPEGARVRGIDLLL
jgi:hypothetical protein